MRDATLEHLATLPLPPECAAALGLEPGPVSLERAIPSSPDHLGLQYRTSTGAAIAGQWIADPARLARVAAATSAAGPAAIAPAPGGLSVLLQARGADRELKALAVLAAEPGAALLAHRPERRGVARLLRSGRTVYAKVVRQTRLAALIDRHARVAAANVVRTPQVVDSSPDDGVAFLSEVPGSPVFSRLTDPDLPALAAAAGAAIRRIHDAVPSAGLAEHGPSEELAVVEDWARRIAPFRPRIAATVEASLPRLAAILVATPSAPAVAIHRDFYDRQCLLPGSGPCGIIDFDLLARGEPALDLANFLAHLELRALQSRLPAASLRAAADAFIRSYDPSAATTARMHPYTLAARLRLACVYAVRPPWPGVPSALLDGPDHRPA